MDLQIQLVRILTKCSTADFGFRGIFSGEYRVNISAYLPVTDTGERVALCFDDYRPGSIFKMLAYYHETLRNRSSAQVGKDTSAPETYACSDCFDTGTVQVPDPDSPYSWAAKDAPCPKCSEENYE